MNSDQQAHKEIRYLRFLNNTLQIKEIRENVCDEFTRKIFDYLEADPPFDAQIFCAFLYKLIFECKLYRSYVMSAEYNPYEKSRLKGGRIVNQLSLFLTSFSVSFAISSVDPYQFHDVSIEEKLKHLLPNSDTAELSDDKSNALSPKPAKKKNLFRKAGCVKIVLPEISGNMRIVPYLDLEFTLPRLSVEQKLDAIHFAICALNYLSWKEEPEQVSPARPNPISNTPLPEIVSKPEHLTVVSENLIQIRHYVILDAVRDEEIYRSEFASLDFDQNEPTVARIIKAQTLDTKIEKQWLDKNSLIFVKSDIEDNEIYLDEKLENQLSKRQWLIAMSFFVNAFKLRTIDKINFSRLLAVMNNGKNFQDFRAKFDAKDLITAKTANDAQKIADLFREFNLPNIADDIENQINKLSL